MGGSLRGGVAFRFGFDGPAKTRPVPYDTMTLDQIMALPVPDMAAKDAHLYVWATNRYVENVYDVVRAWGFKPSTLITWKKKPMGGGLGGAWGISSEHVLY